MGIEEQTTDIQFEKATGEVSHFEVTVVRGNDAGKTIQLDETKPGRTLVGQGVACEFRLSDRRVSRRHASLEVCGDRLRVTDLESTNGTLIANVRILDAFLSGGEHLTMGETVLAVTRLSSAPELDVPLARGLGRLVGSSLEMRRLYPLIERLAQSRLALLIEGETGTGKELLAETLHALGPRASGPFVVLDCPSLGDDAGSAIRAAFEEAHGGTLLLDEVGELAGEAQPLLLRAIERGEVSRPGASALKVDVRMMAATRLDLDREVQEGRFRDDLFYRLVHARLELPPLRQRRGDIGILARHFWTELGGAASAIPYDAIESMERGSFPGNVRELQAAVVRLFTMGNVADVPSEPNRAALRAFCNPDLPYPRVKERLLAAFEREYVESMIERHGNVQRAAAASGLALRYFQLMRAKYR
jgi:DNA-binding NtrC family response regulator